MSSNSQAAVTPRRGDDTRERLLDSVEALIADQGFQTLTHRLIAQRADVHVALLNYHFGSKEQLIEEALARRAPRLIRLQTEALANLRAAGAWTVEDVLWAIWQPFAVLDASSDPGVAQLSVHRGAACQPLARRRALLAAFHAIERECIDLLHRALPEPSEDEIARGLRFCRLLFERELTTRCGECVDRDEQRRRSERMIAFLAGGLRALQADVARATG
jgi:AcrR family transcriptional regulator